jgi:hypothetical protein
MKKLISINKMNPKIKSIIFIISLIIIGLVIGKAIASTTTPYLIDRIENPDHRGKKEFDPDKDIVKDFELSEDQKEQIITGYSRIVMIYCVDIVLLIGLIWVFFRTYMKTKSNYLIGFIIFVGVFLAKSISSLYGMTFLFSDTIRAAPLVINPLIRGNFGPFGIYFTILEIFAICILIYLSRE